MTRAMNSRKPQQSRWWLGRPWTVSLAIVGSLILFYSVRSALLPESLTEEEISEELKQAAVSLQRQDLPRAKSVLDRISRSRSVSPDKLLKCAQLAVEVDEPQLANRFLENLGHSNRFHAESQYLRGVVAIRANLARSAERWWRAAVVTQPGFTPGWERLCQLYMTQLRGDDVRWSLAGLARCRRLTLDELVVLSTPFEPYYSADERLPVVQKYVEADHEDQISLAAMVRYELMNDRIDEALAALNSNPRDQESEVVASVRFDAEIRKGITPGRPENIAQSLNQIPVSTLRRQGLVAWNEGDWSTAAWCFRRYVSINRSDTEGLYKLGQSFERLQFTAAAEAALRLVKQNEELNNVVYRVRRTTHLPAAKLAPLICDIAIRLNQLGRDDEASLWLGYVAERIPDDLSWREAAATISRSQSAKSSQRRLDWDAIESVTIREPLFHQKVGSEKESDALLVAERRALFFDCQAEATVDFEFAAGGIGKKWLLETLGGGVAAFDYDGDGWPDLYFCQGGSLIEGTFSTTPDSPTDRLFRNLGNGRFQDVTAQSGLGDRNYSQGCAAGDFDNDGDADLFVANFGANAFYRNNGDGRFTEITTEAGLSGQRWHTSAAFADLDNDGDLDLFIATYVGEAFKVCRRPPNNIYSSCSPANYPAEFDVLLWNRGDGTFEDVSAKTGIQVPDGKGLGVLVADFNNDHRPDIYVTNDGTPNFLFQNEGNDAEGHPIFSEIGMRSGCALSGQGAAQAGMGIACDDFDDNGFLDLFTTNFFNECTTLYLNQGAGLFVDATRESGLIEPTRKKLGFGAQCIDFDLSSHPGVFVANGHIDDFGDRNEPWKMRPQLFATDGHGHFREMSQRAGPFFEREQLGRAAVRVDFNRDLKPDLIVSHLDRTAAILRNDLSTNVKSIAIDFVGTTSNRDGRGCRVIVTNGSRRRVYELVSGDGFLACNERRMIIGLGENFSEADLTVEWPSGLIEKIENLQENTAILLIEGRKSVRSHACKIQD